MKHLNRLSLLIGLWLTALVAHAQQIYLSANISKQVAERYSALSEMLMVSGGMELRRDSLPLPN